MRISLFWKILFAFLLVSVVPAAILGLLLTLTYEDMISKYQLGIIPFEKMETLRQDIRIQAGLIIFLIIIMVGFVTLILARGFFSPIKKLDGAMKKVAAGELDVRLAVKSKDEFGELANSFNQMAVELQKTNIDLAEVKTVLEIKIQARTKELRELAQNLETQVQLRTKELEQKVSELERFQKLSIGRELKMVELKEEVKGLKEELKILREKNF